LRDGYLQRCDETEALLSLLRVMAMTPQGSWSASPQFGLRQLLEQSRLRADAVQAALADVNRSLDVLGVRQFHVAAIARESARGQTTGEWVVTLESADEPGKTVALRFGGGSD
jgi:hypothetical protein